MKSADNCFDKHRIHDQRFDGNPPKADSMVDPRNPQSIKNLFKLYQLGDFGADERTRTFTGVTPQRPQRCASTNSATSARVVLVGRRDIDQPSPTAKGAWVGCCLDGEDFRFGNRSLWGIRKRGAIVLLERPRSPYCTAPSAQSSRRPSSSPPWLRSQGSRNPSLFPGSTQAGVTIGGAQQAARADNFGRANANCRSTAAKRGGCTGNAV